VNDMARRELTDVMMEEDFVGRQQKLKEWGDRWIATLQVTTMVDRLRVLSVPEGYRENFLRRIAEEQIEHLIRGLKDEPNNVAKVWVGDDPKDKYRRVMGSSLPSCATPRYDGRRLHRPRRGLRRWALRSPAPTCLPEAGHAHVEWRDLRPMLHRPALRAA
jgi:hypothetical protein